MINVLFIAIGLAMDSFGVSLMLGGSYKKKFIIQGLISSAMFGGFQALMPIIGWVIGETFKSFISGIDHWVAFILLFLIGLKMIYETKNEQNTFNQKNINFKLIFSLAIATSIDALIVGMGIAFLGVSLLLAITIIGVVTFFLSLIGIYLGSKFCGRFQNKTGKLGGFILIFIGVKILIDHLFF